MKKVLVIVSVILFVLCFMAWKCFAQSPKATDIQEPRIAVNLDKTEEQIVKKDADTISINKIAYDKAGKEFIVATQPIPRGQLNRIMQNIDERLAFLSDKDKVAQAITELQAQKAKIQSMLDLIPKTEK